MCINVENKKEYAMNCRIIKVLNRDIDEMKIDARSLPVPEYHVMSRRIFELKQWRERLEFENLKIMGRV